MNNENLGPAERIIQTVLAYSDHVFHNRPGMIVKDTTSVTGVKWSPVARKKENDETVVYSLGRVGKKSTLTKVGVLKDNGRIMNGAVKAGEFRDSGIFPEVATWLYRQVAEVWKLDNEFAARWASYEFGRDSKDLKVILASFMLCQSRKGDPVMDGGKFAFLDEDYRSVGEAMALLYEKNQRGLDPKQLLRVYKVLKLPQVVEINRELGFAKGARREFLGRWEKTVEKWLLYREENPKLLEGLVKKGFRTTVMDLAMQIRYKPQGPRFYEILRWKQKQKDDGRRTLAIGQAVAAAESWEGLTEEAICKRIVKEKPAYNRITSLVPSSIGLTRAIVAAAIEAGCFSNRELIIATPTLEELGLLQVQDIRERWERATKAADDMRAANIARNVKSKDVQEQLVGASDAALQKTVEQVTKNLRIYVIIDVSGSMGQSIEKAKMLLGKFLQGFPPDRTHVAVFNTAGRSVEVKHPSAIGITNAFKGISAEGGTAHGAGVLALAKFPPSDDEDSLFIFIGDGGERKSFETYVAQSKLRPMAFGFLMLPGENFGAIDLTAAALGIPCFRIQENTFDDVYAIPRTIRALVAATPVGVIARVAATPRVTLVDTILKTELLRKPAWAASVRSAAPVVAAVATA